MMKISVLRFYAELRPVYRSLFSAFVGFIFYGGWAYFVHMDYSQEIAIKAFFTQGLISFFVTLVLTQFMEVLFAYIKGYKLAYWFVAVLTSSLVAIISLLVNLLVGTPEVLMTILPGLILSTVYSFSYTKALVSIHKS